MKTSSLAFFVCLPLLFSLPDILEYLSKKEYPVHKQGAVLITGASSGIGKHAALHLDELGYTVYAGVRSGKDAVALLKERPSLKPIIVDVAKDESVVKCVSELSDSLKASGMKLVGLVNNAGVSHRQPLELDDLNKVRFMYEVNVFGVMHLTQLLIPLLRESKGRVINIGSMAGRVSTQASSAYSGTKFALEAITDTLRRELGQWKVSVSIVEPAYVKTLIAEKQLGENAPWLHLTEDQKALYGEFFQTQETKRRKAEELADSPQVTSHAIEHALTSPFPRTRYPVANSNGVPAWILARMLSILPDRVADSILG